MDVLQRTIISSITIVKDAILSGAWIYPIHGVVYFISHPSLYRSVQPVLTKCLLISAGITAGMFVFTYLPQVAFCAIFSGPLAFAAAGIMVLGESYALVVMVTKMFILEDAQDKIFDAVLLQQGHEALVSSARRIKSGRSGIKTIGRSVTKPLNRFTKDGLIRYLISLPLNSIPIVGTIVFLFYNGLKAGPRYHSRYFQLKGLDAQERETAVQGKKRRIYCVSCKNVCVSTMFCLPDSTYSSFGAIALALDLVPIAGLVFSFTSTIGAALWASDLEKKNRGEVSSGREADPGKLDTRSEVPVDIETMW
ncbi:hypothetical protein F5050DRAFT_1799232 [Lentinula boryana]|uniref:Uncharacterized protein n=1 Tax=Lentinula boryana TaxID=40481 RepID=A0ABQ8QF99_9AGAR|nr:hypothetical protein F5050DRAFT_1799232 [Lentinula boryana]